MKKCILYLIAVLCILPVSNKISAQTTAGNDFWLAFGQFRGVASNQTYLASIDMQIKIVATEATKVNFYFSSNASQNQLNVDVPANTVYTKVLNTAQKLAVYTSSDATLGTTTSNSLHITSDKPISVYALIRYSHIADATNVLPANSCGLEYYHVSYKAENVYAEKDGMTFVAIEDGTTTYTVYDKNNVLKTSGSLTQGQVKYMASGSDMTGYRIESNKPVAYFVTHQGTMIPDDSRTNIDNLFQQMAPVNSWGTKFFVPSLKNITNDGQDGLRIRIVASQNGTVITQTGGTVKTGSTSLSKGQSVELEIDNTNNGCFITSNKPVGVCSYLLSYSSQHNPYTAYGGPANVWIPPLEQSIDVTTVAPFTTSTLTDHYAIIVTPEATKDATAVTVNGTTTTPALSWTTRSGYSFAQYTLTNQPYTFSNQAGVTVLVAGLGASESYYYLAGASLYDLDMAFTVNGTNYMQMSGTTLCTTNITLNAIVNNAQSPLNLKWYIDGQEQTAAQNLSSWNTTLTNGSHTIRMDVVNMSGVTQTITTTFVVEDPVSVTAPVIIRIGETVYLSPSTGGTWTSSNSAIATVTDNGEAKGIAEGKVRFGFLSTAGCYSYSDTVTVTQDNNVAVNDIVSVMFEQPVTFDVLANDFIACNISQVNINIISSLAGNLTVNADKTLTYTPVNNTFGIDSVEYSITCGTDTDNAKIYFIISKPLSGNYVACEKDQITIGMTPITGVQYSWYDSNNTLIQAASNTVTITKNYSSRQKFYAEPVYKGKTFPRIQLVVFMESTCGSVDPFGCIVEGQLLFHEDFGGNDISNPRIGGSTVKLPADVTTYTFRETDKIDPEQYALVKYVNNLYPPWHQRFSDHTYPNDTTRGYMFLVDASSSPGKFYEKKITGLCNNINKLYFSVWVANEIMSTWTGQTIPHDPILKFELSNGAGIVVKTYTTQIIPRDPENNIQWRNYGFDFDPQGLSELTLKIFNDGTGSTGNDFALDDIEIRLCVPPITIENKSADTVCIGSSYTFEASYTDDGTYTSTGSELSYRWEYRAVSDPQWTTVNQGTSSLTTLNSIYTINNISVANQGYYRLIVANASTINAANCRVVSDSVYLHVKTMEAYNDMATVDYNKPRTVNILANDSLACCSDLTQFTVDYITVLGLHRGSLTVNPDNTVTYTPDNNTFGIDSAIYTIQYFSATKAAILYTLISKPLSESYMVCETTKIYVGMKPINDVKYFWYDSNNMLVQAAAADSILITKDEFPTQTFYVEPVYKGKTFPRITVNISLETNCGSIEPVGCAVDGQLLFREDFGGNDILDPRIGDTDVKLPAGVTDYTFKKTDRLNPNEYALVKYINNAPSYAWQQKFSDHTHLRDTTRGYMFLVDASTTPIKFYEKRITGLCDNVKQLYFSVWVANVIPKSNTTALYDPVLKFELLDDDNNVLGYYITPTIPRDPADSVKWRNYGFGFDNQGHSELTLKIYNQELRSPGNDFAMDDIEIRLCVPPITVENESADTVCTGSSYTFEASYEDDGTYTSSGSELLYRWEYSAVNDPQATWITLSSGTSSLIDINTTFTIDSAVLANQGYYRLMVANTSTVNEVNCRVLSEPVYLHVFDIPQKPEIRSLYGNYELCGNVNTLTLEIRNPENGISYQWYKDNSILAAETGLSLIVNAPGVYKVQATNTTTGCLSYADTTVTKDENVDFPNPVVSSVSGSTVICGTEGSVLLRLNNQGAYNTTATYQWYKDGQIIANATSINYNATTPGDYFIKVTDTPCVAVSSSITVSYNGSGATAKPDIKSQGDITVLCSGTSSLMLYVDNTGSYSSTAVYVWYRNDTEVLRGAGLHTYTTDEAGSYSVYVYSSDGCGSGSDTLTVTQGTGTGITTPQILSESGGTEICGTDAGIMLGLTTSYTGTTVSYQWFKGTNPISGATSTHYYAAEAGDYSILVTVDNCSSQSDKLTIIKDGQGTMTSPILKSEGNVTSFCEGSDVKLYVDNAVNYGADATYVWYKDSVEQSRGVGLDYIYVNSVGLYNVLVYESGGCLSISQDTINLTMVDSIKIGVIVSSNSLPLPYGNTGTMLTLTNVEGGATPYVYTWYSHTVNSTAWVQMSVTTNPIATGAITVPTWFKVEVSSSPLWSSCNVLSDSILIGVDQVELTLDIIPSSFVVCNVQTDSLKVKITNTGQIDATDVVVAFHNEGSLSPIANVTLPKVRTQADTVFTIIIPANTGATVQSGVLKAEIISCNQTDLNPATVYGSWKNAGWTGLASQADEDSVMLTVHQSNLSLINSGIADTICSGDVFDFTPISTATDVTYTWTRLSTTGISELQGTGSISNLLYNTTADHKPLLVTYVYYNSACQTIAIDTVHVLVIDSLETGAIISSESLPLQYNTETVLSIDNITGGAEPYRFTWYRRAISASAWTYAGGSYPFATGNLTEPTWFKVEVRSAEGFPICNSETDSIFIDVSQVELKLEFMTDIYSICNTLTDSVSIKVSNIKPGDATNVEIEFKSEGTLPAIANISLPILRGNSDTTIVIWLPENVGTTAQTGNIKAEIISCDQNDSNPLTIYGSWKNANWAGNATQADEDMLNLTLYPNMQLTSKLKDTICSGETFTYEPQSNLDLITVSWIRYAVAGISENFASGQGDISEVLTNNLDIPVTVIYTLTLEKDDCPSPITFDLEVVVLPKGKLTLSHTPGNGSRVILGTPITITATLEGSYAKEYIFTYGNDVTKQTYNQYEIFIFNERVENEVNVQVENEYGCILTGMETFIAEYGVPNVITPNETTNNKLLRGYDIQVFNRWGSQLYKGKDGWDGRYKGTLVASGTYLYVVHITQPDGKILTIKRSVYVKY
ncbi:MAG: gliding motility-associated C-terminal domain-containing protein [Prevotellaceae bacterium]|nr:gliding motility-associated C-terminal domain-containing protein [Prevotellaceae bacterium]